MGEAAHQLDLIAPPSPSPPKPYEVAAPLVRRTPVMRETTREPNATGRIARDRVQELAKSIRDDIGLPKNRWIKAVAPHMGLKHNTLQKIMSNSYIGVSTETIDAIVKARGVERKFFFDPSL